MTKNPFEPVRRGGEPDPEPPRHMRAELPPAPAMGDDSGDLRKGCGAFAALLFVAVVTTPLYGLGPILLFIGVPAFAYYMRNVRQRPQYAKGLMLGLALFIGGTILLVGACFAYFAHYSPQH